MIKQVIVLRKDLNMRKGKMVAQGAHASMKVFLDRGLTYDYQLHAELTPDMVEWVEGKFAKIVLGVESEEELLAVYEQAQEADIPTALITDDGRTEFHGEPTHTAVAVGPAKAEDIDPITGSMKLL